MKDYFLGRKHYEVALKLLPKTKEKLKLLEVGAQDGVLKPRLPQNISYSSLDMDGKSDYNFDLNKGKLPIKTGTFDILVCLETLEHTFYPEKVIEELKRVTRKNGLFILSMPNEYNFWLRLNYLLARKMTHTDEPFQVISKLQHIHRPRVEDIINLFSKHFKIIKVIPMWQSRRAEKKIFYFLDKIINYFAKIYPSLFSRVIIIVAKNKGV